MLLKKVETEFDQELKKQHPDCTDVNKLEIMQKHQGYKKKLAMRPKRKCLNSWNERGSWN